ncbi:MAG TPA: hypothetical protein VN688_00010 [Gemmataceae bacterium]|nr:hypothetical protein [Gemmataceae bacterium]
MIALSDRLDALPLQVYETHYVDLGTYRGLKFGMILHPTGHPEIYLQGETVQKTPIRKDAQGLAVLNALERLAEGYAEAEKYTRQDLTVSEAQLSDYQQRIGRSFPHEDYLKQLTILRDQLRAGLSSANTTDQVAELAEQIKALRSSHRIEAAPERTGQRRDAGEEPVTARIRRRAEKRVTRDSEDRQQTPDDGSWQRKLAEQAKARAERVREPG